MGWITLYEAYTRLQQEYPALVTDQPLRITEAAVRSGQPFVRGEELGRHYPELIGDRIKINEYFDVWNSKIRDDGWFVRWMHVEVQWEKFIFYVKENLLPAWISPNAPKRKRAKPQEQASRRKRRRRRGPVPGSAGYSEADAALFPEMESLVRSHGGMSPSAAALELVLANKVAGGGSPASKAKRLAARFLKERRRRRYSLKLTETR
jgi:hypothetical protein